MACWFDSGRIRFARGFEMKRALSFIFIFPVLGWTQNLQDVLKQGAQVFIRSCATGYCHAPKGEAGGSAPRLAARGFDQTYINNIVNRGVPGTAMPAFTGSLSLADRAAVVAYVATLNGITNPAVSVALAAPSTGPVLSADAARGRDLFSEAVRGFGRCSTCHEVNGIGISVTTAIARVPENALALRELATPSVATATVAGETTPALVVSKGTRGFIFYDLTTPPPVLRTEEPSAVKLTDGSNWKHSSVISSYNDAELEFILEYLRTALN
jgi:mono/diheme cytochrome c family protein